METSVLTASNITRTYAYDTNYRLTQVVVSENSAGDNGTTTLAYDGNGFLASITEPGGRVVSTTEAASGGVANLTQITDAVTLVCTMAYDGSHHLTSDTFVSYSTSLAYDASTGLLDKVTLGSGTTDAVTYALVPDAAQALSTAIESDLASQATVTDPLGRVAVYDLDTSGRMTGVASPVGSVGEHDRRILECGDRDHHRQQQSRRRRHGYDHRDLWWIAFLRWHVHRSGRDQHRFQVRLSYDPGSTFTAGSAIPPIPSARSPGTTTATASSPKPSTATATSPTTPTTPTANGPARPGPVGGESVTYSRDSTVYDNITQTIESGMVTTTAAFDGSGHMTQSVDGNGHTMSYAWSGNNMTAMVSPIGVLGSITAASWSGNVVTITASNSLSVGDTVSISGMTPSGYNGVFTVATASSTTFTYALTSNPGTATVLGAVSAGTESYAYDASGRTTKSVDADFRTTTFAYDANGNPSTTIDPLGHTTSYTYDGDNRLIEQINPASDSAVYTYDADGFQTASVVGGISATATYDVRGWMTQSTDGNTNVTTYGYDAVGHNTSTVLLNTLQQVFDSAGRVVESINGVTAITSYAYDANGNVIQAIDADGQTTAYTYDAANRLLSTTDPLGRVTSTAYDLLGRATATTDGAGVTTYSDFDNNGNVTATVDGLGSTTLYTYDLLDHPSQTTIPLSAGIYETITQYYDAETSSWHPWTATAIRRFTLTIWPAT